MRAGDLSGGIEYQAKDFVVARHEVHLEIGADVLEQFVPVALVRRRQYHDANAVAFGANDFLPNTANRKHMAGQGQFPGHRHVPVNTAPPRQRDQRRGHLQYHRGNRFQLPQ